MAVVRVDFAALAVVAGQLQPVPQWLATANTEIQATRAAAGLIGDQTAALDTDELLRQLDRLVGICGQTTLGLTRSLTAASHDYAAVEQTVVRYQ